MYTGSLRSWPAWYWRQARPCVSVRRSHLALFRDVPLVRHATTLLAGLCPAGVYVVAGTAEQAIRELVAADGVQVIGNPDWASGLASSLACGIRALPVGADAVARHSL